MARIAKEGVGEAELARVKTQWVASETYKLDSVMAQARELGSNWVQGLPLDASERIIARLQAVTAAQVQAVAAKYFGDDQLTVAILRPLPPDQEPPPRAPRRPRASCAERRHSHVYSPKISQCAPCWRAPPLLSRPECAGRACRSSTGRWPTARRSTWWRSTRCRSSTCSSTSTPAAGATRRRRPGLAERHGRHGREGRARRQARPSPALDQNALGEAWADLGASFDVGAGTDRTSFSLRTLSDPALLDKAVALAAREIGEPSFPDDVWQRERERINAAIKEANTKPGTIAGRAFAQAVYGVHPYGQEVTEETLARIDTAAMRQRYEQLIVPCRAKLSIVGAVTRAAGRGDRDRAAVAPAATQPTAARALPPVRAGGRAHGAEGRAHPVRLGAGPCASSASPATRAATRTTSRSRWATTCWAAAASSRA